jgi:hypothetical protein
MADIHSSFNYGCWTLVWDKGFFVELGWILCTYHISDGIFGIQFLLDKMESPWKKTFRVQTTDYQELAVDLRDVQAFRVCFIGDFVCHHTILSYYETTYRPH